jgi:hypothetical protein
MRNSTDYYRRMAPAQSARSVRALLIALVVAIVGVLSLDATKIVAAPNDSGSQASSLVSTSDSSNTPLRLLHWSHVYWMVFPNSAHGPDGPHTLSDSRRAARVDSNGRLHLRVTKVNGKWRGVQLESLSPLNYGTYRFVTSSRLGRLAKPLVLGMFTYKPSQVRYTNEIDIENSRALIGLGYPVDAQYVVQPYYKANHIHRYAIRRKYKNVTQQFTWQPGRVDFRTTAGSGATAKRLSQFTFSGADVPTPNNEHVYINLHLHHPYAPRKGTRSVVLDSYSYTGP